MGKFKKKPIEVEAHRLNMYDDPESTAKLASWCNGNLTDQGIEINTNEGIMLAVDGDWIIKEPNPTADRTHYPCKPSIFESSYEQVDW